MLRPKAESAIVKRQPGRPKDESIHQAAIKAVLELLGERGFEGITFEEVAARAGISRPALYRRWKKKEELIAEALETQRFALVVPDTGSLRGDLLQGADDFIEHYATPLGRQAILDILKAGLENKPVAQSWASSYGVPRMANFRLVFTRAIERGELSASIDIETMMFIISSSLLQTCLLTDLGAQFTASQNIYAVIDFMIQQHGQSVEK